MLNRRHQLTLFVPEPQGPAIDALRRTLDPVQASLIAAHVTLCRDDEFDIDEAADLLDRAERWPGGPLCLAFGPPRRFQGHGILLPCIRGSDGFHQLRQWVLQDTDVQRHEAHLTLAHPRNPRSAGNDDNARCAGPVGLVVSFPQVAAIEQHEGGPWQVRRLTSLGGRATPPPRRDP